MQCQGDSFKVIKFNTIVDMDVDMEGHSRARPMLG